MSELTAKEYTFFEEIKHISENGLEFWYARELSDVLTYTQWRNFAKVLERAMLSCNNSGYEVSDHFAEVSKTIEMPKDATKKIVDYKLTRYACYLTVQNGDPRKEIIALGQTYFAIQDDFGIEKSVTEIEKEQLKKLKKSPKKLMLDE